MHGVLSEALTGSALNYEGGTVIYLGYFGGTILNTMPLMGEVSVLHGSYSLVQPFHGNTHCQTKNCCSMPNLVCLPSP